MVQILDILVPQKVEQLLEVFRLLDTQMPVEQAVAAPMISLDHVPQRCVDLVPQMVEQLVDVPSIVSYSSFQQRSAEQIVDIPVPHGRGRRRQGFLPGQASSASVSEQIIDIPVPRRGGSGSRGPQGFHPRQSSAAFHAVQNVDTPVPAGGGPRSPDPGASASSAFSPDELDQWVFRIFRGKKSGGCEHALARQLMDAGGLWAVHRSR